MILHERKYTEKLRLFQTDCSFNTFRSIHAKLAWVVNTGSDITCAVAIASQVTEASFNETEIRNLNKVIRHLRRASRLGIVFPKLHIESKYLAAYSDASFNNDENHRSQIGYIISLMDYLYKSCILIYS